MISEVRDIMHELSIAYSMLEIALDHARQAQASEIREIELEIGELAGVIPESLEFCFEAVCKDTVAEGSCLSLKLVPAVGVCEDCRNVFKPDSAFALCPECSGMKIRLDQGKEMRVKSIVVD